MADWTLITTTLGASAISATTAYLIAKRAAETTAGQVAAETTRIREQIEAENERLRVQHQEDHLRNRQGTYHAFLNVERDLQSRFAFGATLPRGEYDEWAELFFSHFNGVLLFGPESLRPPMEWLRSAHGSVYEDYMKDKSPRSFGEKMGAAYHAHLEDLLAAREACLDAMRADVAPPP
jgi:hypothetical protein